MRVSVVALPLTSVAVTAMMLTPPASGMPAAVQLVVPVAAPLPPRLLTQVTEATPVSSAAVPASVMLDASEVKVGSAVGEVMVITGGVPDGVGHVDGLDRPGATRAWCRRRRCSPPSD